MTNTNGLNVLTQYINGASQNTKNGTTVSSSGLNIGVYANYPAGQQGDGRVSEVIVYYNTALSASSVQSLQANQKTYYGTP